MQTAIISDLHLGSLSGRDLLRDPLFRDVLLKEIEKADRLVLLGDVLELFELPLQEALERARPFLEELGDAMAGQQVVLVPGNHDHRLAEPLLDQLAAESRPLGLEHHVKPSSKATELLGEWLGAAELELAYPGIWLRDDVYAMHGHYIDCYRRLPRLECVAAATVVRARGALPDQPTPQDYERVLSPIYGLVYDLAQAGLAHRVTHSSERVWRTLANGKLGRERKARRVVLRNSASAGVWLLNHLLRSDLRADLTPDALSETGIAAATELAQRLQVKVAHMITGHTHRAGPTTDEAWPLSGGGHLHNTGSWILTSTFRDLGGQAGAYLPGTVTWLKERGPPYRTYPLASRSSEELQSTAGRLALERL
jgi:predicted phosphodiesterase